MLHLLGFEGLLSPKKWWQKDAIWSLLGRYDLRSEGARINWASSWKSKSLKNQVGGKLQSISVAFTSEPSQLETALSQGDVSTVEVNLF